MDSYYENYLNSTLSVPISVPNWGTVAIGIGIGIGLGSVEIVLHIIIEPNFIGIGIGIGVGIGVGQWKHTIESPLKYLNDSFLKSNLKRQNLGFMLTR